MNNLSLVFWDIGELDRALEYLSKTLDIDRQLKDEEGISIDLLNIGETYRRKGLLSEKRDDFISSLKYYNSSLEISKNNHYEKLEIKALNNIGAVYSQLAEHGIALDYFKNGYEKAKRTNDIEEMSILLTNLGIVYSSLGKYKESTQYYKEAISLALQFRGDKILWEAYLEIANVYKKQNIFIEALANYKNSISIIENVRSQINLEEYKAGYMGTDKRLEAYQNLLDLLVTVDNLNHKENYGPDIFNFFERAKARAFLDSLEISNIEIKDGASQMLINQEAEIMGDISRAYAELLTPQLSAEKKNSLNQNLESLENQLQTVKRKIREMSPAYAGLKYPEIITLKEAQEKLADSETAFFAYSLGKEKSYAFVLTRHQFKVFPLPPVKELRNQIQAHLKAISDPANLDFRTGYDLYMKLISPGLVKGIKKIIIIPDDFLYFLPFETLLRQNNNQSWLIEEYKISYSPSLSSLREIIQRKKDLGIKAKQDLLAIGDPDYGTFEATSQGEKNNTDLSSNYGLSSDFKLNRLQYSGLEIDKIASLFPRNKIKILEKDLASEETLKAQNLRGYKIIHFATHGLIDDKKPARSAIVLKLDQDPQEDGFLQMREIFNLKLNADLVTLSACQTGGGQLIRGEGIEGLSRAFFYAGASSVLMSLWAVNDQATYQLMERFYSHLRSSESLTSALQKAQVEMIDSGTLSHPYYWAGFIISGNSNTAPFQTKLTGLLLATFYVGSVLFIAITSIRKKGKKPTNP
jgi:CHAT domain-containing protein